jgi:hypothetical protein
MHSVEILKFGQKDGPFNKLSLNCGIELVHLQQEIFVLL